MRALLVLLPVVFVAACWFCLKVGLALSHRRRWERELRDLQRRKLYAEMIDDGFEAQKIQMKITTLTQALEELSEKNPVHRRPVGGLGLRRPRGGRL